MSIAEAIFPLRGLLELNLEKRVDSVLFRAVVSSPCPSRKAVEIVIEDEFHVAIQIPVETERPFEVGARGVGRIGRAASRGAQRHGAPGAAIPRNR